MERLGTCVPGHRQRARQDGPRPCRRRRELGPAGHDVPGHRGPRDERAHVAKRCHPGQSPGPALAGDRGRGARERTARVRRRGGGQARRRRRHRRLGPSPGAGERRPCRQARRRDGWAHARAHRPGSLPLQRLLRQDGLRACRSGCRPRGSRDPGIGPGLARRARRRRPRARDKRARDARRHRRRLCLRRRGHPRRGRERLPARAQLRPQAQEGRRAPR